MKKFGKQISNFRNKSVKCIICKVSYNTYDNMTSVAKVDYRGAAAPKNENNPINCVRGECQVITLFNRY